jgi:hypothetical protein
MECETAAIIIIKVSFAEEPKWTIMMAKNMCQVVNRDVETLADVPKQEERKLNFCFTGFKAK